MVEAAGGETLLLPRFNGAAEPETVLLRSMDGPTREDDSFGCGDGPGPGRSRFQ